MKWIGAVERCIPTVQAMVEDTIAYCSSEWDIAILQDYLRLRFHYSVVVVKSDTMVEDTILLRTGLINWGGFIFIVGWGV